MRKNFILKLIHTKCKKLCSTIIEIYFTKHKDNETSFGKYLSLLYRFALTHNRAVSPEFRRKFSRTTSGTRAK